MPIPLISKIFYNGLSSVPYGYTLIKVAVTLGIIYLLKLYFSGASNKSERVLHGKVAIITGGTSGIGASVAANLAKHGCQLVLLTRHPLSDPFLVDYIDDLRTRSANELITAEQVDLADLNSVRKFATKWIDNAPPRRLDMVVLCADEITTANAKVTKSKDGVEIMTAVNYLANFHLMSILSPALKMQPFHRDVRIIVGACSSYMGGDLENLSGERPSQANAQQKKAKGKAPMSASTGTPIIRTTSQIYASTKLAMLTFSAALQKHLADTKRPEGMPPNIRVLSVDPGWTRTTGMLRYMTGGSLWGLLLYIVMYPLWWLVLKSPSQGAQPFLWAAMDKQFYGMEDTNLRLIKECRVVKISRPDVMDEKTQKTLWQATEKSIEALEKQSAKSRARGEKPDKATSDTKK
jgi:NAD(P)-dependent dehydrogenase (short-subunit alcohol dehydrogenase family)